MARTYRIRQSGIIVSRGKRHRDLKGPVGFHHEPGSQVVWFGPVTIIRVHPFLYGGRTATPERRRP